MAAQGAGHLDLGTAQELECKNSERHMGADSKNAPVADATRPILFKMAIPAKLLAYHTAGGVFH